MKRALVVIFLILAAVSSSILTRLNTGAVSFHYYFGSTELSLAILLLGAVIIGAVIGLLFTLTIALTAYSEKRRLRKKLKLCKQEIQNLRDIPIKGRH